MNGAHWYIRTEKQRDNCIAELRDKPIGEFGFLVKLETGKRTTKQRNALEVYCRQVAEALETGGFDMREVCTLPITPTQANVKENIWKRIQKALTGKTSTTELDRKEVSLVYEHMARALAERFQVIIDFPERDRG